MGNSQGILFSNNKGTSWVNISKGIDAIPQRIYSLLITKDFIFAGTAGNSIWRRSLSEIINK